MEHSSKYKLGVYIYIIFWALILLLCSGCSTSNYRRKEYDAGPLKNEVHLFNSTFLMWTRSQDIFAETVDENGIRRTLAVGDFEQVPDANSIKAITEGAVVGGVKVLRGGL